MPPVKTSIQLLYWLISKLFQASPRKKSIFFEFYIFTTTLPVDFRFLINSKAAVVSENGYM